MRFWVALGVVFALTRAARAADVVVPVPLQAALLAKVAAYDKNLAARAGDTVRVVIVTKSGDGDSTRVANQMSAALASLPTIAGKPHAESVVTYSGAAALVAACKQARAAILYITPGFSDAEIGAITSALASVDLLTVAAQPEFVALGVVLGFDLVSSKPQMLVHLPQAQKQHVAFGSEILSLMRVVR